MCVRAIKRPMTTILRFNPSRTGFLVYVISTSQLTRRLSYTKNSLCSVEGERLCFLLFDSHAAPPSDQQSSIFLLVW